MPPQDARKIVELPPDAPGRDEPPPSAQYLSDRDRHVEKETVSKYAGNHEVLSESPQAGAPGRPGASAPPPAPPPAPQPAPGGGARAAASPPERAKSAERKPQPRADAEGADRLLALAPKLTPREPGEAGGLARVPGSNTPPSPDRGEAGTPPAPGPSPQPRDEGVVPRRQAQPDLSLSPETMARIAKGPGMAAYNEAEEGDFTALNTRDGGALARWGMRLQRQVGSAWDRIVQHEMHDRDPTGEIFFYKERTVVLGVVLDAKGNLKEVSVVRSSNVQFFDETALAAIRQAQPYETPPQALFTEGVARFPFRFTFYPERRSIFIGKPLP
jgi:TonB family protein